MKKTLLSYLIDLLFPKLCAVCGSYLVKGEHYICLQCVLNMPLTRYWNMCDNPVEQLFWGRVKLEHACALFFYTKTSKYRKLIYQLKYQNKTQLAYDLGVQLGHKLKTSRYYSRLDYIVPLPIHPQKKRKRGYNQTDFIAYGVADVLKIPVNLQIIKRIKHKASQTQKDKLARWSNMEDAFLFCGQSDICQDKHFLIIDDVITTGATLDACAQALLHECNCKISIAAIGFVP